MCDWYEKVGIFLHAFLFSLLEDVIWGQVAHVGWRKKNPINPNAIAYDTLRKGMFVEKVSEYLWSLDFRSK